MPGLDGRQLYEKLRVREQTRHIPFIFLASRTDIEEKLRPLVEGVEEFIPKPFFVKDLVRSAKKVVDRLRLEKLQNRAVRPGVIQGRLEEMGMMDLMQSLEMGQKSCRLTIRHGGETCEMFFGAGQCKDARLGQLEGETGGVRHAALDGRRIRNRFQRRSHPRDYQRARRPACSWKACSTSTKPLAMPPTAAVDSGTEPVAH